jgi:hypothetical protein
MTPGSLIRLNKEPAHNKFLSEPDRRQQCFGFSAPSQSFLSGPHSDAFDPQLVRFLYNHINAGIGEIGSPVLLSNPFVLN